MTLDIYDGIKQARNSGQTDEEIFNYIKSTPKISAEYQSAIEAGKNPKDVDKYLKQKLNLNAKQEKTPFQNAYETLTTNPAAYILEKTIGKNPISEGLQTVQSELVSGAHAGLLSLPHEITHFPENMLKSMQEFHGGDNPGFFEEGNSGLRSIIEPPLQALDWLSQKTGLKDLTKNLYTFQQAKELLRGDEEPEGHLGKASERIGAGLGTAGPIGGIIGAADYIAEIGGLSPEQRGIMALMIAKVPKNQTGVIPTSGKLIKSEPINSVNDLAAKMIAYNPDDINLKTMKAAFDLNIPIEDIPLQALYKNGLPNLMEGISQNSFVGSRKFDNLLGNFTTELTSKVDNLIGNSPIDAGIELITSKEHIGEPNFKNFLPEVFENTAPQLEIPKHETGKIGTNVLKLYDEGITSDYKNLYDQVQFKINDLLRPSSSQYDALEKKIKSVQKKLSSKGFKGGERREALGVISDIKELFKMKETVHPITGEILKEKPNIKLEHIRKNIQDLNKTISYEHPSLVNLLEPIAEEMRSIIDSAAQDKPHLYPLLEANELFREKAQFFQDPIIKHLLGMTDEAFYRAIRNKPSYLKKFSDFAEKTDQTAALNDLKGKIMADILEKPLKATSPKEFVQAITDKVIQETRELEPFYPELKGLSKSLEDGRKYTAQFLKPEEQFKSKIRQKILEDIMSDSDFTDTLNLMNSPKGISLVESTLANTPQGKNLYKSLKRKKIEQVLYEGSHQQEINLQEFAKVFDNAKSDAILKTLLSPENYRDAKTIAILAKEYVQGSKKHQALKTRFEKGVGLGLVPALFLSPIKTTLGVGSMALYLTSKSFKKALLDRTKNQYDLRTNTNNKKRKTN